MSIEQQAERLTYLLAAEVALLEALAGEEQSLQDHLIDRNWVGLDETIKSMSACSEKVVELESERESCYSQLKALVGAPASDTFYEVLARMPIERRNELAGHYRNLKVAIMRVRGITGGIEQYVATSTNTMKSVMDELFPENKGRMYSRSGQAARADERAMVLDHRL